MLEDITEAGIQIISTVWMQFVIPTKLIRYMSSIPKEVKHRLITILGATGTGKSELAVSLARKLNGEVINGDALQLYEGLPIVTNKIAPTEQYGIRHHLLGTVPLEARTWNAPRFAKEAMRIIEDIRNKGKIPILVGGTHYYLQSTLFTNGLVTKDNESILDSNDLDSATSDMGDVSEDDMLTVAEQETRWPILKASPEEIRAELLRVDPVMAARWHPNDFRKIRHSLLICLRSGRPTSEIYANQAQNRQRLANQVREDDYSSDIGIDTDVSSQSILRYDNLLFWTYTKHDVLDTRLSKRVEKMIERGLLDEIKQMYNFRVLQEQNGQGIDLTRGVWIAIGYKQFAQYLDEVTKPVSTQIDEQIQTALAHGIEKTHVATRQYAKYQHRWIRSKLLSSLDAAGMRDKLFLLNSSDITEFSAEVEDKAIDIATRWLASHTLPQPQDISPFAREILGGLGVRERVERSARVCELCDMTVMTDVDWMKHEKSTKHKRAKKRFAEIAHNPRYAAAVRDRRLQGRTEVDIFDSEVVGLAEAEGQNV